MRDKLGRFKKGHKIGKGIKRPGFRNKTTFKKGQVPWNKGLTAEDSRVAKYVKKNTHKIKKTCEHCGGKFEVNRFRKDTARFCSIECKAKWLGEKQTGKGSPAWKGGYENKLLLNRRRIARKHGADGNHTLEEWEEIKKLFKHKCAMCNRAEPNIKLTEDHIIPLTKGGSDYISNIQPLCKNCNSKKGNRN